MKSNACLSLLNMLNVLNAPLLLLVQNTKCAFTITGVIWGTYQTKLYSELGLESLKFRRWFRRLCTFFKTNIYGKSECLSTRSHQLRFITILGMLIKLRLIIAEKIFWKTLSFFTQWLSEINLILIYGSLNRMQLFEIFCLN